MAWEKIKTGLLFIIYIVVTVMMYNALNWNPSGVTLGGFTFMYMYLLGIGIIVLAFLMFLTNPQVPRIWLLAKYVVWISMPFLFNIFISLIGWVWDLSAPNVIIRGVFLSVYQILAVMVAAATLYLFGDRGIEYHFVGLALASCITMVTLMGEGGVTEFMNEFRVLLVSGAMETGKMMKRMESTGHTYAFGMYIMYFLLFNKGRRRDILALMVAILFFAIEFKRSALFALIVVVVLSLILRPFHDGGRKVLIGFGGMSLIIVAFVYVWMVKSGLYETLTDMLGIDTSGRNVMYSNIASYYEFSPFYRGLGLGYVTKMLDTGQLNLGIIVSDLHNDFLRQFIEQGFWGYLLWLLAMFIGRVRLFLSRNTTLGIIAFTISVFYFVTFFSENMYFFFYGNISMALLMMGYHFEEQVEKERENSAWL